MGFWAVIVPMFPKCPAILTIMPLRLPGKLTEVRRQRVVGVFFVKHRGHVVGAMGVSSSVIDWGWDWHGSRHGHVDWGSDVDV